MELTSLSYPKVNIGLYVSGKREDGYHNIASVFQKIYCIYDVVKINLNESDRSRINVRGLEQYTEEKESTVYKAAMLWQKHKEKKYSIEIDIDKKIPVRSGLGSPSSNAATVLLMLEEMSGKTLENSLLCEIAAKIGSDVPFFLCNSDAAFVSSRGECIKEIKARQDLKFKLVKGLNEKVSTKEAYRLLDDRKVVEDLPSEEMLVSMYNSDIELWNFRNDFELVNPRPASSEKIMLTGSGPYWFAVSKC